jgi:hypothetical protein
LTTSRPDLLGIRHNAELDSIRARIFELETRFSEDLQATPELATVSEEPQSPGALPPPLPIYSALKQAKLPQATDLSAFIEAKFAQDAAAAVTFFVWQVATDLSPNFHENFLYNQAAAFVLLAVAIFIRCPRLILSPAVLGFLSLSLLLEPSGRVTSHIFATVFIAFAAAVLLHSPWIRANTPILLRYISSAVFRITAFVAYMVRWYQVSPEAWVSCCSRFLWANCSSRMSGISPLSCAWYRSLCWVPL